MQILDPGHKYKLATLDGDVDVILTFVKRNKPPDKYPGNLDAYPGTTMQEGLRAYMDRTRYVQEQSRITGIPCSENEELLHHLGCALVCLENRAARLHGHTPDITVEEAEYGPFCPVCGHVSRPGTPHKHLEKDC